MPQNDAQNGNGDDIRWEYFINNSKGASPQFDEFCRGLATVIRQLEPYRDVDLSPARLANFYRACGADLDELFRNNDHGVSFLYRTLGCYHSLQPTRNAFETPSIPCLTEDGYVRWQTLQMLLCPEQHARIIQKAAEMYSVPRKKGGTFPKAIPIECFPTEPDAEMERWHRFVTSQINSDVYQRRLKYSPYQSPVPENTNSPGGYFARAPLSRRPSHNRRKDSMSEEELARIEAAREAAKRRSSVPDIPSPGGTLYNSKETAARAARSRSVNRPVSGGNVNGNHLRQRSYTNQKDYLPPPGHRPMHGVTSPRHSSNTSLDRDKRREPHHSRDQSSGSRMETASDASSEDSYRDRRTRKSDEDSGKRRSRWGSSLMPSFFLSNNKRRHSSDGRVPTLQSDRRSPARRDSIRKYKTEGPEFPPPERYPASPPDRTSNGVRFSNVFNPADPPQRPEYPSHPPQPPPSSYRYSEPQANVVFPAPHIPNSTHPVPNLNYTPSTPTQSPGTPTAQPNHYEARKQGLPTRINTFSGVNGRRYQAPETRSMIEPAPLQRRDRTSSMRNPVTSTVI